MTVRPDPVLLDSGHQVDVLEELATSAPLGVRFWDWAMDRPVREGLLVRARPEAGGPVTTARPSSTGVYGFVSLPTTRDAERGSIDNFPSNPGTYLLGVSDTLGRYVAMSLSVAAPVAGVQPAPGTLPEVDGVSPSLPGFYLFASATRRVPPGYLAVRLDLSDAQRPVTGAAAGTFAPAAHALVEVAVVAPGGDQTWYGVSDDRGRALVLAPAPPMAVPADGAGPLDLSGQQWSVRVRVHYERLTEQLTAGDFPGVPDFADLADQADATANFAGAAYTPSTTETITYGEELVVNSPQRSDLLVKAPAHP